MKEYKFSDRIVRTSFELVIVKRSESEMERREEINSLLMIFPKEANELLHIIREHRKGIPISKVFEAEAKAYKYGKEIYCNVIKKQIEDTFENTDSFAYQELSKMKEYQDKLVIDYEDKGIGITFGSYPGISFIDEYIGRWSTPDTKEEFKVLNELMGRCKT